MVPSAIGIDVGGAGTKSARLAPGAGAPRTAAVAHEAWRAPERLAAVIAESLAAVGARPGEPVALTTTAELCDVFPTKAAGVHAVLDAADAALGEHPWTVWTTDGTLVSPSDARDRPLAVAAANWLATATVLARGIEAAVLCDVGSTTSDVVPLRAGACIARGRTDRQRLVARELVYTGALRTDAAAILREVPLASGPCPVSAERFAIAADAHLLLGHLDPAQADVRFPDGRGPDEAACRARLARLVCADPPELAEGDVEAIATAIHDAQVADVARALRTVADQFDASPPVIAVGVGAFLGRAAAAAAHLDVRPVPPTLGADGLRAPAAALAVLAAEAWAPR